MASLRLCTLDEDEQAWGDSIMSFILLRASSGGRWVLQTSPSLWVKDEIQYVSRFCSKKGPSGSFHGVPTTDT
jgi:hypothetical protein